MTNKMIDNRVRKLQTLNEQIRELEEKAAELREELVREIESRDAEEIQTPTFLVRWTRVIRNTLDSKKLKADLPLVYASYLKSSESRRFSIA